MLNIIFKCFEISKKIQFYLFIINTLTKHKKIKKPKSCFILLELDKKRAWNIRDCN